MNQNDLRGPVFSASGSQFRTGHLATCRPTQKDTCSCPVLHAWLDVCRIISLWSKGKDYMQVVPWLRQRDLPTQAGFDNSTYRPEKLLEQVFEAVEVRFCKRLDVKLHMDKLLWTKKKVVNVKHRNRLFCTII